MKVIIVFSLFLTLVCYAENYNVVVFQDDNMNGILIIPKLQLQTLWAKP